MKKLFLAVAIFLFGIINSSAQEWIGVDKSIPVKIQESLVLSSEEEIIVDVKVGGFFQNEVKTPYGNQMIITGEDMASMLVEGAPDLPMYPISMIIGDNAEMKASVIKSSYVDFKNIEISYKKAAEEINADLVIPSGKVFQRLIESGVEKVHRDTFHASLGLGRYALGLLWYSILSGNDVKNNTFCDFDEEISKTEIEIAKECVAEICNI